MNTENSELTPLMDSKELNTARLTASLTEYQELRTEIRQVHDLQTRYYLAYLVSITAAIGAALSFKIYDIFLVLPLLGVVYFLMHLWYSKIIARLSKYLVKMDGVIGELLGDVDLKYEPDKVYWIGWQTYYDNNYRKDMAKLNSLSTLFTFVATSVVPSIVYCALLLIYGGKKGVIFSSDKLPCFVYYIYIVLYIIIGIFFGLLLLYPDNTLNFKEKSNDSVS